MRGLRIGAMIGLLWGMLAMLFPLQASGRMVEIVLDASGSMAGPVAGGESKIVAAKKAVTEWLGKIPGDTILAWRAYGHQSPTTRHDCRDTQLLVPFSALGEANGKSHFVGPPG